MPKISVYLDEELAKRLARIARDTGSSQAEILRAAVAAYEPLPADDRAFALAGCVAGPGGSVADADEDELLSGFGGP